MRQSRIFGSGREVLPDVREWSGGPPGCLGVVRMPSQMSKSGRVALSVVQEALLDVTEWLRGPPGCQRVIGRPAQMSGSDREALPDVHEWSEGFPIYPRVVR